MPCDSVRVDPRQTVADRQKEVRKARLEIDKLLATKKATAMVDKKTGAVVLIGIPESVRANLNDACVVRYIMTKGSHAARQAIAKAEAQAGRTVNKQAINAGLHSHDGGSTWGTD